MFCKGKTKKGTDCCRSVKQGFEYCFQHVPKGGQEESPEGEPKEEPKTESKFPKIPCNYPVGERTCLKFSYDGTGRCHIHKDKPLPKAKASPKAKAPRKAKPKSFCFHFDPYYGYCNNYADPGSQYCKFHKQPPLCNYKFANGSWCNYYAKKGGKYCPLHSGDYGNYQAPPSPQKTPATTSLDSLKYFELPETTTYDDIKKKYRQLALKYHPDKGGNPEDFKTLQKHYDILTKKYNTKL